MALRIGDTAPGFRAQTTQGEIDFAGHRLHPAHGEAQGRYPGQLEARAGRDHRRLGERQGGEEALPRRRKAPKPYLRITWQPE